MKYEKDDDIWLFYRGTRTVLVESTSVGRQGSMSDSLGFYITESGKRILPVHFRYGLAEIPGNPITWHLKVFMPPSILRAEMQKPNYLLDKIKKDDNWKGSSYLSVPFNR